MAEPQLNLLGEKEEPLSGRKAVDAVWERYVQVMNPRRREGDPETRKLIREALKVATVDELCGAIEGCAASPFHMGSNDRGKKYNRPEHIFKGKRGIRTTRAQIDLFLDVLERQPKAVDPSDVPDRFRRALNALDDPELAGEARAFLEREGYDGASLQRRG